MQLYRIKSGYHSSDQMVEIKRHMVTADGRSRNTGFTL